MVHVFIVNSYAGNMNFATNLRAKLNSLQDFKHFVFNTREAGSEETLVREIIHIFAGEKLRIYCCGGSGTFRNIVNGIDNLSEVEVAFFPCGLTNDFLKHFPEGDAKRFDDITELIDGDVVQVDYIQTNYGKAVNTLSTGIDQAIISELDNMSFFRMFGGSTPYTMATLKSLMFPKAHKYDIVLDNDIYSDDYIQLFMGNGPALGGMRFIREHSVTDGRFECMLVGKKVKGGAFAFMLNIKTHHLERIDKLVTKKSCSRIMIKRKNGEPFWVNLDGELVFIKDSCNAEIVKGGLHLVVPKGVKA